MQVADRKMDPASRKPQKMVRKSSAMGYNSLKSHICIGKKSLGAYGVHKFNPWVWGGWELFCDKKYAGGRTENGPSFQDYTETCSEVNLSSRTSKNGKKTHMLNFWVLND